jgi:hypothetical protein
MKLERLFRFNRRKDVGEIVFDACEIHLIEDDEHGGLAVRRCEQHRLQKLRHDVTVREHIVIACEACGIRPLGAYRAKE